jgi:hypothetical protein
MAEPTPRGLARPAGAAYYRAWLARGHRRSFSCSAWAGVNEEAS